MPRIEVNLTFLIDVDKAEAFDRATQRSISADAAEEALMRIHSEVFGALGERLAADGWKLNELSFEAGPVVPAE